MNDHCVRSHKTESRSWSDIRGELSVLALIAVVVVVGLLTYEVLTLQRKQIETTQRLIQRLDTDALITELALKSLEKTEPSEKAQRHLDQIQSGTSR